MTDEPDTIVYRRITDPGQINMAPSESPVTTAVTAKFHGVDAPWRRLRRRGKDDWLWQSDDGSEGRVTSRSEGLTMIALHAPDLRHLVEPADG